MKRTRAVAALAAVLAIAVSLAACDGNGDDHTDLKFGISKVDEQTLDATLASAETALAKAAKDGRGVTADRIRCWAEATPPADGGQKLSGNAFCGPVLFADSDPSAFWAVYDIGLQNAWDEEEGETVARTGEATLTTGTETVPVDPTSSYLRPDGATMPTTSGLEVPPPAELASSQPTSA